MDLHSNINPQDLTFEKVWLLFQETDRKIDKLGAKIDRLAEVYGGFMNNVARTAEGYFYQALQKMIDENDEIVINGFKFYRVLRNITVGSKKKRKEIDILLENVKDKIVAFLEIKMNLREEDIEKFASTIAQYVKADKIYFDYRYILGVGGYNFEQGALQKAKEYGMFILKRNIDQGQVIFENTEPENIKIFEP